MKNKHRWQKEKTHKSKKHQTRLIKPSTTGHFVNTDISNSSHIPNTQAHTNTQLKHNTHTHTKSAGLHPRAEQTVHFMNINTKCTGPPAIQYKGRVQRKRSETRLPYSS